MGGKAYFWPIGHWRREAVSFLPQGFLMGLEVTGEGLKIGVVHLDEDVVDHQGGSIIRAELRLP